MDEIVIFDEESTYLRRFNPAENTLFQMQKMHEDMHDSNYMTAAVCIGNYIYVLMKTKSVYRLLYLDEKATWEQMQSFTDDHGSPPAVKFKGCIYVIGGNLSRSVEKYDTQSNEWTILPDKLQASEGSTPVVFNDQIYCCGGVVPGNDTIAVEKLDSGNLSWTTVNPELKARVYASAVSYAGKLYVLGGYRWGCSLTTVECYDGNDWVTFKPMIHERDLFQSFEIDGQIYAVGGDRHRETIEKYDFQEDEWQDVEIPGDVRIQTSVKIT